MNNDSFDTVLSSANCGCGKLGIGLARDGIAYGHLVGLARRDVPAVGLGEGGLPFSQALLSEVPGLAIYNR